MSDAWRSLKITQFEQVSAGSSLTLLRITGTGPPRTAAAAGDRPSLLADDGHQVARFPALPSPPDTAGVLRAAYSVPQTVLRPETVLFLEFTDGEVIPLPAPVRRAENGPGAVEDAVRRELEQRNAELEQRLRERQAALDELEVWRGELERRLASMSTELGETTARLRAAEQEVEALRTQLADVEAAAEAAASPAAAADEDQPAVAEGGPPPTAADAPVDLDDLRRRAAARAGEVAARELAEASAETPQAGL